MEREIKFRGKKGNRWFYGGYHKHIDITPSATYKDTASREKDILAHTHHVIVKDEFSDYCMPRGIEVQEVEADTIGQYVGKKDRNGVEIYEGDILKWHNAILERDIIAKVVWDKLDYGYSARNANNVNYFIPKFMKVEVIGNIYDNPELIYKEK